MGIGRGAAGLSAFAIAVAGLAAASVWSVPAKPVQKKPAIDFSRDVLPILSNNCFLCHGPDSGSRQAGLRLDQFENATTKRAEGRPIFPYKPGQSLMVQKIAAREMPPPSSGKNLTSSEIATLKEWVAEGAHYAKHWAFQPLPRSVPVPKVAGNWANQPLDKFVRAQLTAAGLKPSPPASRERWLRRVTLDLTGLPPTEPEIAAFKADREGGAFERVVDRLLNSPHYGERLAVDWLDAARYADSYGYQSDLIMPVWPYRDWVIDAFNQNLPYDRFLTDQLAGDLIPNHTRDEVLATAFNRLHRQSNEGGSIAAEFKCAYADDRVETFGTAVLGLTLTCARCHDHKYDPITQREYYQLYAYFNSINEYGLVLSTDIVPTPSLLLPNPDQDRKLSELKEQTNRAKSELRTAEIDAEPRFLAWLGAKSARTTGALARFSFDVSDKNDHFPDQNGGKAFCEKLRSVEFNSDGGQKAAILDGDNGIAVRGVTGRNRWDSFTWSFAIRDPRRTETAVLLHRTGGTDVGYCGFDLLLQDGFLTARVMRHWPGNAVAVRTVGRIPKNAWTHVAWSWDGSGDASGLTIYIDGRPTPTVVLANHLWKKIAAYGDLGDSGGDWDFGQRFRDTGFKGGELRDIAFTDRALSSLELAQLIDGKSLTVALRDPSGHKDDLRGFYLASVDPVVKRAREAVQKTQQILTNFEETIPEISVMHDTPTPEPAYLLARGLYDAPKNASTLVHRGVPHILPPLRAKGENDRLALAKWVTEPNHPLTARVAVNRFWQMLFGNGLVETTENFGIQGGQPSNPKLLDYLARRFVDSGWNVKALLRTIVLSSTYRQDSASSPQLNRIDPKNRLLARGPSGRLPAEMVRDVALAASGLLNEKIGGPPVNPYQPAGLWTENNTMTPPFVQSKGADLYRRTIYSTWKRTTPMPSMLIFDATAREACVVKRPSTNTPLQALVLLNDVQFVEAARVLAERVLKEPGDDSGRLRSAFLRLAGREPDAVESRILLEELAEQRATFAKDPKSARALIQVGESGADHAQDAIALAAMTVVVQMIMNSDAVIWKR